jgi:predicted nucleic acid-binding protein
LRRNPRLQLIRTLQLLPIAEEVGCNAYLRGADALYAAAARMTGTPLVTWDRELLDRGGGITPLDWLSRNP